MFEIGFWELALLFALGLVVLGPEKLPKVAAQLGRYAGQARRMARTLTSQIREEIEAEERRILAQESTAKESATAKSPVTGAPPETPEATYSRPGMDDLIPRTAADEAAAVPADPDPAHRSQA